MEKLEFNTKQEELEMKGGFISKMKGKFLRKLKNTKLAKKVGDDKLVITLVLVALGVGLCIVYRNALSAIMTTALASLSSQINNLFAGTIK